MAPAVLRAPGTGGRAERRPLVAADGLAAAFRMVDKFESRMVTCPLDPSLVHEARVLRLRFLDAARAAAEPAARAPGPAISGILTRRDARGSGGFLAARNVSLEHVQYDFSSERALLGEGRGSGRALNSTSVKSALNATGVKSDDPARLMVAAACACAEQAERSRGATTRVTPFFSPTQPRARAVRVGGARRERRRRPDGARFDGAVGFEPSRRLAELGGARGGASLSERRANANANAWLAPSQRRAAVRTAVRTRRFTFFARRERRGASRRAVFDIATAGYDPLSVSMVPRRRVSADSPRDALASPEQRESPPRPRGAARPGERR